MADTAVHAPRDTTVSPPSGQPEVASGQVQGRALVRGRGHVHAAGNAMAAGPAAQASATPPGLKRGIFMLACLLLLALNNGHGPMSLQRKWRRLRKTIANRRFASFFTASAAADESILLWSNDDSTPWASDTWRNAFGTCDAGRSSHEMVRVAVEPDADLCERMHYPNQRSFHGVRSYLASTKPISGQERVRSAADLQFYTIAPAVCAFLRSRLALADARVARSTSGTISGSSASNEDVPTKQTVCGITLTAAVLDAACGRVTPVSTGAGAGTGDTGAAGGAGGTAGAAGVPLASAGITSTIALMSTQAPAEHVHLARDASPFSRGLDVLVSSAGGAGAAVAAGAGRDDQPAAVAASHFWKDSVTQGWRYALSAVAPSAPTVSGVVMGRGGTDAGTGMGITPGYPLYPRLNGRTLYAHGAPRTFFMWNKALAAALDVSPPPPALGSAPSGATVIENGGGSFTGYIGRMVDDGRDLDVEGYKHLIKAFREANGLSTEPDASAGDGRSPLPRDALVTGPALSIYVVSPQLPIFLAHVLPYLRTLKPPQPYILVTGSSDYSAPLGAVGGSLGQPMDARIAEMVLDDPLLWLWLAQNPDILHAKVVPLPIGFDFHTLADPALQQSEHEVSFLRKEYVPPSEPALALGVLVGKAEAAAPPPPGRTHPWGPAASVQAQDWSVQYLRCALPPLRDRPTVALMNFKEAGRGVRSHVAGVLRAQAHVKSITDIPRAQLWAQYGEAAFVLSPRGYGRDCHRTWEALALGSIPIVSYDPFLAPLYALLPVVVVTRWTEVTEQALEGWKREVQEKHAAGAYRWEILRTDWWLALVQMVGTAADTGEAAARLAGVWRADAVQPMPKGGWGADAPHANKSAAQGKRPEGGSVGESESEGRAWEVDGRRHPGPVPVGRFIFPEQQ